MEEGGGKTTQRWWVKPLITIYIGGIFSNRNTSTVRTIHVLIYNSLIINTLRNNLVYSYAFLV